MATRGQTLPGAGNQGLKARHVIAQDAAQRNPVLIAIESELATFINSVNNDILKLSEGFLKILHTLFLHF
ncbi:MAG: hypothetical protein U9R19_01125 [Bacteroidota bacterium]|nr:hypothetical protein [Bacteroidota bacterium]